MALPDPQEIAYVGSPLLTQEVDFLGTIWEPYWQAGNSRGGPAVHSKTTQAERSQSCFDMVQNKVAWNRQGDKSWNPGNVNNLCEGALNPTAVVDCFSQAIIAHDDWARATRDCKGR